MPDCDVTLVVGIAGIVATLAAAFAGSYLAYWLTVRREDMKQRATHAAAGNKALFALAQQLNRLVVFRNRIIDPVRASPAIALEMQPVLSARLSPLMVDMESLAFLLEQAPSLCMRLMVEQDRFDHAEALIKERSRLHHDEVQPAISNSGLRGQVSCTPQQIEDVLGNRLFTRIVRLTEQMVEAVDSTIVSNARMQAELWAALKAQFPERKFVKAE